MNAPKPNDMEVVSPPPDSISSLSFSPQADFLAAASWDNNIRIYEVAPNGQSNPKAMYGHEAPALDVTWSSDGTKILSGGADKAGRMFDVATGQSSQVAAHDAPIKSVRWIDMPQAGSGILATGSWDKTVKYWDLRTPNPVGTVQVAERVYTMDVARDLMVVGTADRHLQIINLSNPTAVFKSLQSPLRWQTRVVSCFPDAKGYAIGSIEGRVAIQYIDDKETSNNFSFKCHRSEQQGRINTIGVPREKQGALVYSVNDISFNTAHGTFSTCGSDGKANIWDKDSRSRLKTFEDQGAPITATAFNKNATVFAMGVSYDWHKGHQHSNPSNPVKIVLHPCQEEEVRRRRVS